MALSDAACKLLVLISGSPGIALPDACTAIGGDAATLGSAMRELSDDIVSDGAHNLALTCLWLTAAGEKKIPEATHQCGVGILVQRT